MTALAALLVAACGDTRTVPADGAPPDAAPLPDRAPPDAPTPDAAAPDANLGLPNLVLLPEATALSVMIDEEFIREDSCSLDEMCVGGPGLRRLLRFDVVTANLGENDLVVGAPVEGPMWQYSECHMHFHFRDYAIYELLSDGGVVASGHKQAFCLMDTNQVDPLVNPRELFDCENQGIHRGWSDRYGAHLPCQWIDVTDVVPGNYRLRVQVNYEHVLPESRYDDNSLEIPVTVF